MGGDDRNEWVTQDPILHGESQILRNVLIRATPFCRRRRPYHHAPLEGQRTSKGAREQKGPKKKSPNPLIKKINDPKSHQSVLAV